MKKLIGNTIMIVFSIALGFAASESIFRIILVDDVPERFTYPSDGVIGAFDRNHWTYSEAYGYGYPPAEVIHHTAVENGRVTSCTVIDTINERGNIGPIEGTYEDADLRILLFGDSWSAFSQKGVTWTDVFERDLQEALGVEVEVVNFARDGYGVLQMFDMAADLVPEWNPDVTLIAYITNDLARVRTWRVPRYEDGVVDRVVTSFTPRDDLDMDASYDSYIVHHEATADWCQKALASGERDSVIDAIERKYQRANRVGGQKAADPFTLTHSYLINRVLHGDPFRGLEAWFSFPVIEFDDYREDSRFMKAVDRLKASEIPTILYHMAFYPEVRDQQEYIVNDREAKLRDSLYEITEFPVVETLENLDLPVERPERMNAAPDNYHPSRWGMDLYSQALVRALVDKGLLDAVLQKGQ